MAKTLGRSAFVSWDELDRSVSAWAKDVFGHEIEAIADREDDVATIVVVPEAQDFRKFSELFAKYDLEHDYAPEDEFCPKQNSELPAVMSLRIFSEMLSSDLGFRPHGLTAFHGGVIFTEKSSGGELGVDMGGNTRIDFLYRDAANYKFPQHAVISGSITDMQIQTILGCLNDGEYFIPSQVGLPCSYASPYEPCDDDHPFCALSAQSFSETFSAEDTQITADELVAKFLAAKGNWQPSF